MNHDVAILFSMKSMIVFILVMSRIAGMLSTAPLFSTFPIPMTVKTCLAALVAFIMYPMILSQVDFPVPHDLISLTLMLFKEMGVGILIGFCAQLIFIGIQIGGQLLSMQMGLAIAEALDPVTHQNVPIVGQFYLFIASLVFIFLNGHHWLFTGIFESYNSIPMGLNFEFSSDLTQKILFFTGQLFSIAFGVVMPIFAFLFIVDIAMAFLSKIMPQMNIFMVSLPLKIFIGLGLMVLFMTTTTVYMSTLITNFLDNLKSIFM